MLKEFKIEMDGVKYLLKRMANPRYWQVYSNKRGKFYDEYHSEHIIIGIYKTHILNSGFDLYAQYMKEVLDNSEGTTKFDSDLYNEHEEFIWKIVILAFGDINQALKRTTIPVINYHMFKLFLVDAARYAIDFYFEKK